LIKTIGNLLNPENIHLRRTVLAWLVVLVVGIFAGVYMGYIFPGNPADVHIESVYWFIAFVLIAFGCEFVDSTLGMGYGTTLTPLLLIFRFDKALQIVPSVLFTELVTGLTAGFMHHRVGNVNFHKGSRDRTVAIVLALCSIIGTVIAVFLAVYLAGVSKNALTIYIGCLVIVIGIVILGTLKRTFGFTWRKVVFLGTIASFNKGMSGGGYGPVVTGGQILSGVESKSAVGITSTAEGLTCLVGVILFILVPYFKWKFLTAGIAVPWLGWSMPDGPMPHWRNQIDFSLTPALILGSVFSTPFAAWAVKRIDSTKFRMIIGFATLALGIFTLVKVFAR
jgi:uncharacterized membrane protein YfcA